MKVCRAVFHMCIVVGHNRNECNMESDSYTNKRTYGIWTMGVDKQHLPHGNMEHDVATKKCSFIVVAMP